MEAAPSPPVSRALAAADARVAWCVCAFVCASSLNLLLYFLFLAFPRHFPALAFAHSQLAQLLTFGLNVSFYAACLPDVAHAKAPGARTRTLAKVWLCFTSARAFLVYFNLCARPHPCWRVVVTFGALVILPPMLVILRAATDYGTDFWKELRLSVALAGGFQVLGSLLLRANLSGAEEVYLHGGKSFARSLALGVFMVMFAFVSRPTFRLALSNACGIESLYALRLADLCQPDLPRRFNLESEQSCDGESTETSDSKCIHKPTALTAFVPHELQWRGPHRTASALDSGSFGSLVSSDDFAPYAGAVPGKGPTAS
ncbi:MAG: hypothetical protein SGPRY_013699, partial [Prymnesium sp.]